ncbi:MAG: hypothetical protein H6618_02905 [Deltaproteobacteria bacterium]|nr:hypothetical protein [Deltaproteobacteria bacterium]
MNTAEKRMLLTSLLLLAFVAGGVWLFLSREQDSSEGKSPEMAAINSPEDAAGEEDDSYALVVPATPQWDDSRDSESESQTGGEAQVQENVASGNDSVAERVKLADRLLEVSEIGERLGSMTQLISQQMSSLIGDQDIPEKERGEIDRVFRESFDQALLLRQYKEELAKQLTLQELRELEAIYMNPDVRRYQRLSRDLLSHLSGEQEEFAKYLSQQEQAPLPEPRAGLIASLDQTTAISRQLAQLSMEVLKPFFDDEQDQKEGTADSDAREVEDMMAGWIRSVIGSVMQDVPDDDLSRMTKAMDKGVFRKASDIATEVVKKPIARMSRKVAQTSEVYDVGQEESSF